jgi:hypothetical protein
MWYGPEYTRYKCPNGYFFKSGSYPYFYSNCSIVKTWEPAALDPCTRKFEPRSDMGLGFWLGLLA